MQRHKDFKIDRMELDFLMVRQELLDPSKLVQSLLVPLRLGTL
jgi:hypothetical protein